MPKKSTPYPQRLSLFGKISGTAWEYIFQFFMLFLAVTAGFFAENIREEQSEVKQSKEYARTMVKELERDMLNVRYHISLINRMLNNIDALAAFVKTKPAGKMTNAELYRLTRIQSNPPFRWSLATLDQIKSSGRLQYFTNDSIVTYILRYSASTQHLDQDNFEDRQSYRYATELTNRIVQLNYTEQEIDEIATGPDSVVRNNKYTSTPLSNDPNKIQEMVNAYIIARDLSKGHLQELSAVSADQGRLIQLLKMEYGIK